MNNLLVTPEESIFVGDGGSDELLGAKKVGMTTIFSLYLESKPIHKLKNIIKYTDYYINSFIELIPLIEQEHILSIKTDICEVIYSPHNTVIKQQVNGNVLSVSLEEPAEYPHEMIDVICEYLETKQNVNTAYLRLATCDNEQYYLIVIDFFGEFNELYTDISHIAIPFSNGLFFECHQLASEFALCAVQDVKPFYIKNSSSID